MRKYNVFLIWTLNAGTSYYRMMNFCKYMQDDFCFGYSKWRPDSQGIADWENHMDEESVKKDILHLTSKCDIAIAQKFHTPNGLVICDILRDFYKNKKFYTEMDDNVFAVNPDSPAYSQYGPGSYNVKIVQDQIEASNGLIVSTDHLAKVYREYNKNVNVIPNAIDFEIWDNLGSKVKRSKKIVIGWAGGGSHNRDLLVIDKVIDKVLRKHSNVEFVFMGGYPIEFLDKNQRKVRCDKSWYPINKYPQELKNIGIDIALAPLRDNEFNRSKSNLRWLEYSAMSIPTIASNVEPYRCIKNGVDGIVVDHNEDDWVSAISSLVNNESKRRNIGKAAYTRVKEEFNVAKIAKKYASLIKRVL